MIRDAKIAASERVKSGVTGEQLWLKINEPTEKDKGKYTMDIFDGKDGVKRVLDLSGKGKRKLYTQKEKGTPYDEDNYILLDLVLSVSP